MCGLFGFLSHDGTAARSADAADEAMTCARHRGPDESGIWHDDDLVLGFNRLSIIDVQHAHQPLRWGPEDAPERYVLTFNGEIYNYVELREQLRREFDATFRTDGDGEAIVVAYHYWGASALDKLRGMFAFAIWDTLTRELVIARDPFGIKPLYLAHTDAGLLFGSEAKSLRTFAGTRAAVNDASLQQYLVLQYVPEPATIDSAMTKLESGCYATIRPGEEAVINRYFTPTFAPVSRTSDAERQSLYQNIAEVLDDSVRHHMRADVTVGAFLSGGIDSTAIVALAKRHNPDLVTFTTGFERDGYSEIDVAAESAAALGVEHVVRTVSEQELTETLPLIIWYLDDPVADPALVPLYFVANEARKRVKVVLSGEGADELFGGYNIYREAHSLRALTALPSPLRRGLAAVGRALPDGVRGKDMLRRGALDLEQRYYGNARIFREDQLAGLLHRYDPELSFQTVTDPIYAQSRGWDPISRMQHVDLFTWLRGDILVKADKMTMANSLELRVPFLDSAVLEVARTVPPELKVTPQTTKFALRQALTSIVPAHVLQRRKLGFPVPIRHYLAEGSYEWARNIIITAQTEQYLDSAAVLQLLDDHRAGKADHSRRLWTILVFLLWHEIFVTGELVPTVPEPHYPVRL